MAGALTDITVDLAAITGDQEVRFALTAIAFMPPGSHWFVFDNIRTTQSVASVPLPASGVLLFAGLGALPFLRRRARR